jgi:hypothetical protein
MQCFHVFCVLFSFKMQRCGRAACCLCPRHCIQTRKQLNCPSSSDTSMQSMHGSFCKTYRYAKRRLSSTAASNAAVQRFRVYRRLQKTGLIELWLTPSTILAARHITNTVKAIPTWLHFNTSRALVVNSTSVIRQTAGAPLAPLRDHDCQSAKSFTASNDPAVTCELPQPDDIVPP